MSKGRVLVTGGNGLIGSHIAEALLANGYEPYVVDTANVSPHTLKGVPYYQVDVCDGPRLARLFDEVRPDFVSHHAAQISVASSVRDPLGDAQVNVLGTLHVLKESARVGVRRVVFASSGGVLYGDTPEPATEQSPIRPISPYAISKWTSERYMEFYAAQYGLEGVALRYGNVYGPRQNPHGEAGVIAIFTLKMLAGQAVTINGDGRYVRDYVYVQDVALANIRAMEADLPEPFFAVNIGTGIGTDVVQIEAEVRQAVQDIRMSRGVHAELPRTEQGPPRPGDVRSSILACDRARSILGWEPRVGLVEGVRKTVQWFEAQEA